MAQQHIPRLRFPGFDGEWEKSKLGESCSILMCKRIFSEQTSEQGDIPFYKIGTLGGIADSFISKELYNEFKSKYNFPNTGEVLITCSGTIGKIFMYDGEDAYFQDSNIVWIENKEIKFINEFLYYTLERFEWGKLNSTTITRLYTSDLKSIDVLFPLKVKEQQKIASFLSAVDERVRILTQQKTALERYKQGVMQQVFARQIRFKQDDGSDFPEWEERRLGEVFSFKVTNSLSRDSLNLDSGIVRNIHYGDIHTKYNTLLDLRRDFVPFVNRTVSIDKISPDNYCKEGDVVLADASEDLNDVGKSIEIVNLNENKVLAGLHTILARPHTNHFAVGFTGYLFMSHSIRTAIKKESQGTKVLSISTTRLKNIVIPIPPIAEQQKIAAFLSSIDAQIAQVNLQLEGVKRYKKGLLQQLFV